MKNQFYTYEIKENKIIVYKTTINDENVFNDLNELLKQIKREYPYLKIQQLN
jgi:hypothetical protein